ncbi:MAG: ROK family protein [Clostridiales bacterium]|nr:ROK family protein [Clostridiales bacterium]
MFNKQEDRISSQQTIKQANSKLVFKLIDQHDGISRAQIANITKLSPTTISSLTEELLTKELVHEIGTKIVRSSGRRPILLDVNEKGACFICMDLQQRGYYLGIYNLKCQLISGQLYNLDNYDELGKSLVATSKQLLKKEKISKDKLLGIAIGAPGIIDESHKRVLSSTIIPITENNLFYEQLIKNFPLCQIELVNESSLAAYAEIVFVNEIRHLRNLLYIDIHTGIGAGIIIDGNIYRGPHNLAGEFGHISIDIRGPLCKCGAKGCLEMLSSIPAINKKLPKYTLQEIQSRYDELYMDVTVVVNKSAKYLAYGINNAVNLLNPEAVIIGGQITIFGQKYLSEVIKVFKEISLGQNKDLPILLSQVEGNAVTLGGARYLLDRILIR